MSESSRKTALGIVFLTVFIDLLGFGLVLPLLPIYAKVLLSELTPTVRGATIGALMASFSAMQFLFAPLWGRLSDRVGRRPVLMVGLAGSTLAYFLFAVAAWEESLLLLFVSRIGAGIAGATIPTAQAYIADVTSFEQRARGMALIGAAFGLGFTFGPLVGALGFLATDDVTAATTLSPWPGYLACLLSGSALAVAFFKLPESLRPDSASAARHAFNFGAFREALAVPSVGLLVATFFVFVFGFANFESTLSVLLNRDPAQGGFDFGPRGILLIFAYVGVILTFAQGFLVRRLSKRWPETSLALAGGCVSLLGFVLLAVASHIHNFPLLMVALFVEVTGFAFVTPSVQSLISRRSDPARQGGILGVAQSAGSLARIIGPLAGNTLFEISSTLPFWSAAVLMVPAIGMIAAAARTGRDFGTSNE